MDEAFLPLHAMIEKATAIEGELYDNENGVHSYVYEFEVYTPIELDIIVDEEGKVKIGSIPPMYRVETSFRPSFHAIRINAVKSEE